MGFFLGLYYARIFFRLRISVWWCGFINAPTMCCLRPGYIIHFFCFRAFILLNALLLREDFYSIRCLVGLASSIMCLPFDCLVRTDFGFPLSGSISEGEYPGSRGIIGSISRWTW